MKGTTSHAKAQEIEARVRFVISHLPTTLEVRSVRRASALACARSTAVAATDGTAVPVFALRRLRWVANLDYEKNPVDGWDLMDLGGVMSSQGARRKSVSVARKTFVRHIQQLQADGPRPAYIFGTGPSLQLAGERSFSDGITVVCNTIVRDPDLWHHLSPAFLTAGDAIYHFGHTPHAKAFRADALRRLQESDGRTLFVYPSQFDVIVRSEFRDVESLLVPIPYGEHTDATVDLTQHFRLPLLDNVLANQLLPLGCSLSRDVGLWGFDGRAPTDSGFWANSQRHAYPELMQSIRDAHPAFFAAKIPRGNESQYVNHVHGDLLDERLTEAERRGFQFRMLHKTWTPTLQKRYDNLLFSQQQK